MCLITPAVQSTFGAMQLPAFFPEMKEGLSGPGSRNKKWNSVTTALRDWSVVGGSGKIECPKRSSLKNWKGQEEGKNPGKDGKRK